jgi:uncharacterized protein (DUF433 family)
MPSARWALVITSGIALAELADPSVILPPREGLNLKRFYHTVRLRETMATLVSERTDQPWLRRLYLPSYQIAEAAKYSGVTPQTVVAWHRTEKKLLSEREERAALSYLQLIEVAVVAAFRKMGVPMKNIRATRDYAGKVLMAEFPFATFKFKENARHLYLDSGDLDDVHKGSVVATDQGGQLEWHSIIGRLEEFDYEAEHGLALKWHVAGRSSPILIDPRISFGAPAIKGTPTWVIKGRWDAGESDSDIAEDFAINTADVREALKFEGVSGGRPESLPLH